MIMLTGRIEIVLPPKSAETLAATTTGQFFASSLKNTSDDITQLSIWFC